MGQIKLLIHIHEKNRTYDKMTNETLEKLVTLMPSSLLPRVKLKCLPLNSPSHAEIRTLVPDHDQDKKIMMFEIARLWTRFTKTLQSGLDSD